MKVTYDPYSHEAMENPTELYRALRSEGRPVFIEKYNAWALSRFEDVYTASIHHEKDITFTAGQTPAQLLLDEMIPTTFATMDAPEHRKWRGVIRKSYTPDGVAAEENRFRAIVHAILQPLLQRGEMNVYADYSNKVFALNSGYNLGLPEQSALHWRGLIDEILHREPGQIGSSSKRNQQAAAELFGYLTQHVKDLRQHPEKARGHTKAYMEAEIDGKVLNDEELTFYLFSFLILGSETTPMVLAGAIYYLSKHPDQKLAVQQDLDLCKALFLETNRFDQPTNMLCRRAKNDFELNGEQIKSGQNLLYIYASANRDETEFTDADSFDIHRQTERDLTFGAGGHKCLGMHLATMGGVIVLQELISAIGDWELVEDKCVRAYGEHLSGFLNVTIQWDTERWKNSQPTTPHAAYI